MLSIIKKANVNTINWIMNSKKLSILILTFLLFLLSACTVGKQALTPTPTVEIIPSITPTSTLIPTSTPTLAPTPTPTEVPIEAQVPECVTGTVTDTLTFNDVISALSPSINEIDSYRYHTIYQYQVGDQYADKELSLDITGEHMYLQSVEGEAFEFPLSSEMYLRSHTSVTDLQTGSRFETVIATWQAWVKFADDPGWVALGYVDHYTLLNLAEVLSPSTFFISNIGETSFGNNTKASLMAQPENLDGKQVIHRCWILPNEEMNYFDAYINYTEGSTYLNNSVIHLWTTVDNKQIVRFILTGEHMVESLGYDTYILHDTPRNFLLWMDISDVNSTVTIIQPETGEIILDMSKRVSPVETISAPYNDLPLPEDAEEVKDFYDISEIFSFPREYQAYDYFYQLDESLGWYSDEIPEDRIVDYLTDYDMTQAAEFYLDEMSKRGWQLGEYYVQVGEPRITLVFERDKVTLPINLSSGLSKKIQIAAVLPPDDKTIQAILTGWKSYTTENSDLPSDYVTAVTTGKDGMIWIGTDLGVCSFDGETWTSYIEKTNKSIRDIAADTLGNVWAGTDEGLLFFNGQYWRTYTMQNSSLPYNEVWRVVVDSNGRLWLGLDDDTIGVWDSTSKKYYSAGEAGLPTDLDIYVIQPDNQGDMWIGTSEGEIYQLVGDTWQLMWSYMSFTGTDYSQSVDAITFDSQGWMWVLASSQIYVYDGQSWTFDQELNDSGPLYPNSIAADNSNRIWMVNYSDGLTALETDGTWTIYSDFTTDEEYRYNLGMWVDPQGRIWIGFYSSGLSVFTPPIPLIPATRSPFPTPTPTTQP